MRVQLILIALALLATLRAGTLNVIHLGPGDPLKFRIQAGSAAQDFTLAHATESGPFQLPEMALRLEVILADVPALELPVLDKPRLVILAPTATGHRWHVETARSIEDRWAFRAVNLMPEPVELQHGQTATTIPGRRSRDLPVTGRSQIRLRVGDALDLSYDGREPRGVIGLLYYRDDRWQGLLLPDR